jgi:hypothetical protein
VEAIFFCDPCEDESFPREGMQKGHFMRGEPTSLVWCPQGLLGPGSSGLISEIDKLTITFVALS